MSGWSEGLRTGFPIREQDAQIPAADRAVAVQIGRRSAPPGDEQSEIRTVDSTVVVDVAVLGPVDRPGSEEIEHEGPLGRIHRVVGEATKMDDPILRIGIL